MISAHALIKKKTALKLKRKKKPVLKSALAIIEAELLGEKVFLHSSGAIVIEADIKWKKLDLPVDAILLLKQALEAKGYRVVCNGPTGWETEADEIPDHLTVSAMQNK